MIIKPRVRGFICITAYPDGCEAHVQEQVDYVLSKNVPMIPGVATPSEVEIALCKGLEVLKFFPAQVLGGVEMLKALAGPFPNVMFIPTGGINDQNACDYLNQKNVLAVGRSWKS